MIEIVSQLLADARRAADEYEKVRCFRPERTTEDR